MHLELKWILAIHRKEQVDLSSGKARISERSDRSVTAHEGFSRDVFETIDGNKSARPHLNSLSLVQRDIKYISPSHHGAIFLVLDDPKIGVSLCGSLTFASGPPTSS